MHNKDHDSVTNVAPSGGTSINMNLGPDDSDGATIATASFTWIQTGSYALCYRAMGGNYTKVTPCPCSSC